MRHISAWDCFVSGSIGQIAELWVYSVSGALCSKVHMFAHSRKKCLSIPKERNKSPSHLQNVYSSVEPPCKWRKAVKVVEARWMLGPLLGNKPAKKKYITTKSGRWSIKISLEQGGCWYFSRNSGSSPGSLQVVLPYVSHKLIWRSDSVK